MTRDSSNRRGPGSVLALVVAVGFGVLLAQGLPRLLPASGADEAITTAESAADAESHLYTCGMHPHVIQEGPGQCPICGMDLTPMRDGAEATEHDGHGHAAGADTWTCPDHPQILEELEAGEVPGTCPIDGLDLVPVADAPSPTGGAPSNAGSVVTLDSRRVQSMNVRTQAVARRDLERSIRTVGSLVYDPQRVVTVTPKISGWVESVAVHHMGESVRRGQVLLELYAPEMVQTQEELLAALAFVDEMEGAPESARRGAEALVESARRRLATWDVDPRQIATLETRRQIFRTVPIRAPASGVLVEHTPGLEGMAVEPGMELFQIADLSTLWLTVDLFEDQVASVGEGTRASIDFPYFPGESFEGVVRYLEPSVDATTRTVRAHVDVPNPDGRLRRGMFATVVFEPVAAADALVVPSQAVIRTGRRDLVIVALGGGRFAPREVLVGHESEGQAEILAGLASGDEIVTSAQFLIDSESKLRDAVQTLLAERK